MNNKNNGIWYRVWNEETKSWVYGVPMYAKDELRVYTDPLNNPEEYVSLPLAMAAFRYLQELPNGQHLYIGDLIEYLKGSEVKYGEIDELGYIDFIDEPFEHHYRIYNLHCIKVIGNVVENPYLLDEKKYAIENQD